MNASSCVYIDVVIIWTMMSFYQQILHSFSCYKVLCIGNLTYAGHLAVCPSTTLWWLLQNCSAVVYSPRCIFSGCQSFEGKMWMCNKYFILTLTLQFQVQALNMCDG